MRCFRWISTYIDCSIDTLCLYAWKSFNAQKEFSKTNPLNNLHTNCFSTYNLLPHDQTDDDATIPKLPNPRTPQQNLLKAHASTRNRVSLFARRVSRGPKLLDLLSRTPGDPPGDEGPTLAHQLVHPGYKRLLILRELELRVVLAAPVLLRSRTLPVAAAD